MDELMLLGVSNTFVAPTGGGGGYLKFYTLTIDHTQCGSSDSTNFTTLFRTPSGTVNTAGTAVTWVSGDKFPSWVTGDSILINGVVYTVASISTSTAIVLTGSAGVQSGVNYNLFPEFRTVANGGSIQNTTTVAGITVPADLVVSSDNAGSSLYSWEIPFYDATTGIIELHAKIPTVSHTVDTVYYIPYNNSSTTTFQGGSAGAAWNSNFVAVYHFPDGTTLTTNDSTANGYTGTPVGSPTATTGQIDGGISLNGSTQYVTSSAAGDASLTGSNTFTVSLWGKRASLTNYNEFFNAATGDNLNGMGFEVIGSLAYVWRGGPFRSYSTVAGADLNWHKYVLKGTGSGDSVSLYVDNVLQSTYTGTVNSLVTMSTLYISGSGDHVQGSMDEVQVQSITTTADWDTTSYNNELTPNSFYTVT